LKIKLVSGIFESIPFLTLMPLSLFTIPSIVRLVI
jgi:hypothetical protein